MGRRHAVALAVFGAGLLATTGVVAGAPGERPEQRLNARDGQLTRAFYNVEITYTGMQTTRDNELVSGRVVRTHTETQEGSYRASTTEPVRLIAYCVGPHIKYTPRFLLNRGRPCEQLKKRALAAMKGKGKEKRKRREMFRSAFESGAKEAYEFTPKGQSILLEGEVTGSRSERSTHPIARAMRSSQGLVTVVCDPDTQTTERTQTTPQEGLFMFLASGVHGFGINRRLPKVRRVTTWKAVQRNGGILNTEGQVPAREDIFTNPCTLPGVDGKPPVDVPGEDRKDQPRVWQPLDLAVFGRKQALLTSKLSFTKPRGTLGEEFDVKRRFDRDYRVLPDSPRKEVLKDRHRWEITFTPCRNPKSKANC